eukprot:Polyplicarium_translucidae@DN3329_c1_g2_i5.p1
MSVGRALLVENDVRMACTSLESHGTWMAQINAGLRHPIYNQSTRGLKMTVIVCHPLADASVRTMCGSIADLCVRTCRDAGLEVIRIDVGDQRPFRKDDAEPVRVHDDDTQRFSVDISDCGGEEDIAVMSRGRKQGQIAAGADFIRRNIMESKSLVRLLVSQLSQFWVSQWCPNADFCPSPFLGRCPRHDEDGHRQNLPPWAVHRTC